MHVVVELRGEHTYGMTLCDYRHHRLDDLEAGADRKWRGEDPNVEVAVAVNPGRFWELFYSALEIFP